MESFFFLILKLTNMYRILRCANNLLGTGDITVKRLALVKIKLWRRRQKKNN